MLATLDPWLASELVCPRDKRDLLVDGDELVCFEDHRYPVIDGIPVMLLREVNQTHPVSELTLENAIVRERRGEPFEALHGVEGIDPFVQEEIAATNGLMYKSLIGKLREYPIPTLRLPVASSSQEYLLDLGCNWGRWCIAANRLGYRPVGIDPSLAAIRAATRVALQLGVEARYIVADARYLPFRDSRFTMVFSYSVLQHFEKEDAVLAIGEASRVLKSGGNAMIQMPNFFGIRCLYHQARRGFRHPKNFEIRYWKPSELRSTFSRLIGSTTLSVDGYFSLNPRPGEEHLLPRRYRSFLKLSELLRTVSTKVTPILYIADSLYITASKTAPSSTNGTATNLTITPIRKY